MSRQQPQRNGLKIPRQLQLELGVNLDRINSTKSRFRGGDVGRRKDKRKTERLQSKAGRVAGSTRHSSRLEGNLTAIAAFEDEEEDEGESESEDEQRQPFTVQSKGGKESPQFRPSASQPSGQKLKSILKPQRLPAGSTSSTSDSDGERSPSPGLVLDRSSKSFKDRAAQDEAEIAALERRLGLKTKKLPKSFDDDGLGGLLEGIDEEDESRKRKREGLDWLDRKRRRAEVQAGPDTEREAFESDKDDEIDLEAKSLLGESPGALDSDEEDFAELSAADEDGFEKPTHRQRENPYVPPDSDSTKPATKYIPPSLRKQTDSECESLHRLRRQIQGQLNKLSEANLLSILAEVEKLYQKNTRQDVTSTLIDFLLSLFCDASVLQNTFVILHASFVAAVYKIIGIDFGADFVSKLVHRFRSFHKPQETSTGKQSVNLISLLAHLYTFHVIGSKLVFDHIRVLLETLTETNAELLLRVVRNTGPQLRQDDPSSLKDIVLLMQKSAARIQAEGAIISVRTKFMIETITDLKNNKMKTDIASSGVSSEHITRMRKVVGTLNSRNIRASEPLRIGLSDLENADKLGKWWLVGGSWKEQDEEVDLVPGSSTDNVDASHEAINGEDADLVDLARQHRMNTAVRRAIFIAIMSANDYQDANLRLLKLRLKKSQEQEIPRVLIHCAAAEEKYNPYYTLIAKTLCADKKARMAFQFSLWDFFKRIGEKADDMDDDEEDEGEEVQLKEIVNTARMFGSLIADGTMSLGILKTLNLALLKERASMFVEILLIVVISKSQEGARKPHDEDRLATIFARCKDAPQIVGGLRHFLKKVVRHTDLASSKTEARVVKWGCGVAIDTLKVVSSKHSEGI